MMYIENYIDTDVSYREIERERVLWLQPRDGLAIVEPKLQAKCGTPETYVATALGQGPPGRVGRGPLKGETGGKGGR